MIDYRISFGNFPLLDYIVKGSLEVRQGLLLPLAVLGSAHLYQQQFDYAQQILGAVNCQHAEDGNREVVIHIGQPQTVLEVVVVALPHPLSEHQDRLVARAWVGHIGQFCQLPDGRHVGDLLLATYLLLRSQPSELVVVLYYFKLPEELADGMLPEELLPFLPVYFMLLAVDLVEQWNNVGGLETQCLQLLFKGVQILKFFVHVDDLLQPKRLVFQFLDHIVEGLLTHWLVFAGFFVHFVA